MDLKNLLKALKLNESSISTFLGGLVILVVLVLVINYFRGKGEEPTLPGSITTTTTTQGVKPKVALPAKHTVSKGEHLWKIAENYYGSGYNWVDIASENKLTNPGKIEVGQELAIPNVTVKMLTGQDAEKLSAARFGPEITGNSYTVLKGDHLWGISVRAYGDGYRWSEVAKANNIRNPNLIEPGQVLTLPR